MKAPDGPPDYEFNFVVEYCGPLNPQIGKRLFSYSEGARETRNVFLSGKHRPLAFCVQRATRGRALRLHWKDRTAEFARQWRKDEAGKWHRIEEPPPITTSDVQARLPALPENVASLYETALALSVKDLRQLLNTGQLDPHLKALLDRERSGQNRGGAVSALAARYGVVAT